ncbi:glycosyltransferase family 2 protein [bacterium]|nr:glycosyltransferase family 2 protein [bacterium]
MSYRYRHYKHQNYTIAGFNDKNPLGDLPLVSALMVTRGKEDFVNRSIISFSKQTWPNKELVIVAESFNNTSLKLLKSNNIKYQLINQPKLLSLGDYRNLSVSHSTGDYVCIWDDDDYYCCNRITAMMSIIKAAQCDIVFNEQIYIWWEERSILFLTSRRCWEGSMLAKRSCMGVYPSTQKGEDTFTSHNMMLHHKTALIQEPSLYCYTVNGKNTCNNDHFQHLLNTSSCICTGDQKKEILDSFGIATD